LESEHVSLYSLTIEENSRFYQQKIQLPAPETQVEFYGQVVERLRAAGFFQYEISNFAKPGFESRHNIHYWEAGDYIGLGIGAHSHLAGRRWWNVARLKDYLEIMRSGGDPVQDQEELTLQQRLEEALLFGLRQNCGVSSDALEKRYQCRLSEEQRQKILFFCEQGLLEQDGVNLKATDRGRMVLDEISAQLIA
jgi:oxygen-independent coproporphyrinogen-3 oxidase